MKNNALTMLHIMEYRETTLLSYAVFLPAIYVDPKYQVLLKYSQKTVAQAHFAALWRCKQMLLVSVDTTNVECLDSSSESENESISAYAVDILNEILTTLGACGASLSPPRNEQNVIEMIKCFNNQARLLRIINTFEWWDKQAVSDLKRTANVAPAIPVTQPALKELFRFKVCTFYCTL